MVKSLLAYMCSALTAYAGLASTDEVARIVYLVLGAISCAVTLALNVWDLLAKIRQARADGVITAKERKAIEDEAKRALEELKGQLDQMRGDGKEEE